MESEGRRSAKNPMVAVDALTPPPGSPHPDDFTLLLARCADGDAASADVVFKLVYDGLRAVAAELLSHERKDHTLQPTALVHEAYVKMVVQRKARFRDRAHFFAVASVAMRRVLIDHARKHNRAKRGAGRPEASLLDHLVAAFETSTDLLSLDEAMRKLAELRPRAARIIELQFFGGLTAEEAAVVLRVSPSTIEREWRFARAWLFREISLEGGDTGQGKAYQP